MPDKPYEFLEHTADIAVRVYGTDLSDIFINSARAMFEVLVERQEGAPGNRTTIEINLTADTHEELLISWLNELLFLYSSKELVFIEYEIQRLERDGFAAIVTGEPSSGYAAKTEIKAATFHELEIIETIDGFQADITFDV